VCNFTLALHGFCHLCDEYHVIKAMNFVFITLKPPIHTLKELLVMKIQTLILTAVISTGAALSGSAFAATATPKLDKREANQQQRIDQGVASGQLTPRETARLEKRAARLETNEQRAKADGVVTPAERRRLQREANRNSRKIHRQKHDAQTVSKP
jgi:hypothetical protein